MPLICINKVQIVALNMVLWCSLNSSSIAPLEGTVSDQIFLIMMHICPIIKVNFWHLCIPLQKIGANEVTDFSIKGASCQTLRIRWYQKVCNVLFPEFVSNKRQK